MNLDGCHIFCPHFCFLIFITSPLRSKVHQLFIPPLDHINFTSQAEVGVPKDFGGDDNPGPMLNDKIEAKKALAKEEEPAKAEA